MKQKAMAALERVAGNLPCRNLEYLVRETEWGPVYMAIGRGPSTDPDLLKPICWHGVYGISYSENGLARTGEFNGSMVQSEALQMLLDDAVWMYRMMDHRGLLDESSKFGK